MQTNSLRLPILLIGACCLPCATAAKPFTTWSDLKQAVKLWVGDEASAKELYGDIAEWDTSQIPNMNSLFSRLPGPFNADLSKWDVSQVTDMTVSR